MDILTFTVVAFGALFAGFVNGFAGFGTALVASGFWFLVLPAHIVPPLIIVSALAGQLVGVWKLSKAMDWAKSSYLVSGGIFGVPIGAALLGQLNPEIVKVTIGFFLVAYATAQFKGLPNGIRTPHRDGIKDRCVGFIAGIFGGFAGLSGPLPLIWLQLNRLSPAQQRERYQPFNLLILCLATGAMAVIGKLDATLMTYALVAIPFCLVGAALGVKTFVGISDQVFRSAVTALLFVSGFVIVAQSFF